MKSEIRKFSPAIYVLALICFFLPFTHISCQGERVATFTGLQLVIGTTIEQPAVSRGERSRSVFDEDSIGLEPPTTFREGSKAERINPEPLAILVFLTAVIGLSLSFLKGKKGIIGPGIAGVCGVALLLLLKTKIDNDVLRQGEGILRVEYAVGFWLMLMSFLVAIGLNGFLNYYSNQKIEEVKGESYGEHNPNHRTAEHG